MEAPLHQFEFAAGIAVCRIAGSYRLDAASRLVTSVIAQAFAGRHDRLLIVATDVDGIDPPSIPARHQMVRAWAAAAHAWVRMALVVRAELIDAERFAVLAGRNFGLHSEVFENESDGLAWLQALDAHGRRAVPLEIVS